MVTTGVGGDMSYHTLAMRNVSHAYKPNFYYNGQDGKLQSQGHIILNTDDGRVPNFRVALPGQILGVPCTIRAVQGRAAKILLERTDVGPEIHVGSGGGSWWRTGLEAEHRGKTHLIWTGKNNIWDHNRVLSDTRACFHTEPETSVVMGHWYTWYDRIGTSARGHVDRVNAAYKAEYGNRYHDAHADLCDPALWSVPELAPFNIGASSEDQHWLSLGLPPRSVVGTDSFHLNALGNTLLAYGLHRFLTGTAGLY